MKTFFFLLITFLSIEFSFGQLESNNWCFGYKISLSFDNCNPEVYVDSTFDSQEGVACISNKTTGDILFYTNGVSVWEKTNSQMPNGFALSGHPSNTQVLIIPMPSSSEKYYIFTTDLQGMSGSGLRYSVVDMTLNSGLGDVVSKNILVHNPIVCEKLTATWHSNGTDIWVVAHEFGNNNFLSFLVTPNGVSTNPILSSIGYNHIGGYDSRGEIRFSPNGKKLSNATNGNNDGVCANEVFDFNTTTGVISNCITLPNEKWGYGTCFSLDNSKLYFTSSPVFVTASTYSKLYQFDLSSENSNTIIASKTIIDSTQILVNNAIFGAYESCFLGLDGKIYVAHDSYGYMGVVNSPNELGLNCNFEKNGLYLNGKICTSGTNNLISVKDSCRINSVDDDFASKSEILIYPNPFSTIATMDLSNFKNLPNFVYLYDLFGNIVLKVEVMKPIIQFYREKLNNGVYLLKVDNNSSFQKIILE